MTKDSERSHDNRLACRPGLQPESRLRDKSLLSARVRIWHGLALPGTMGNYNVQLCLGDAQETLIVGAGRWERGVLWVGGWGGGLGCYAGNPMTPVGER